MSNNTNLNKALALKNDEFYTLYEDIEKEVYRYKNHLKGKVIYCPCDADWSNFTKFFINNFKELKIKKLITTSIENEKMEYDGITIIKSKIEGDFRSNDCIEILKTSDIIITNPPFSLFRDFIEQLNKYNKKFLVVGNQNACSTKLTFQLLKENKIWLGTSKPKKFIKPSGEIQKFGCICWFTNLEHSFRSEEIPLLAVDTITYYDNYNAVNIDKIKNISTFDEIIGVPITFFEFYNPDQFEILDLIHDCRINGITKFKRVFIKRKIIY